jgi:hypothetical protein
MKKFVIMSCIAVAGLVGLNSFVADKNVMTGIHGTITPAEGAKKVWAFNGTDSASTVPVAGNFSLDVKPGTWNLKVEAVAPYKDAQVVSVIVEEGKSADAGEIKLSQ